MGLYCADMPDILPGKTHITVHFECVTQSSLVHIPYNAYHSNAFCLSWTKM